MDCAGAQLWQGPGGARKRSHSRGGSVSIASSQPEVSSSLQFTCFLPGNKSVSLVPETNVLLHGIL